MLWYQTLVLRLLFVPLWNLELFNCTYLFRQVNPYESQITLNERAQSQRVRFLCFVFFLPNVVV